MGTQDPIQECIVTHFDPNGVAYQVLLAVQYCPSDPINAALRQLYPNTTWRGGVVVMKSGRNVLVTSLTSQSDITFAERAVTKFLEEAEGVLQMLGNDDPVFPIALALP
ncbi:hypothetical protein EUX98_g2209 [Antrodiella citrinella]|uniref:Uncharacterized protein n=1 Tax=Antrodiella citrinella TaxID=2447956 RepID=A0A4S4N1U2_9APHY|nr:hypothetical protein EUX98_g2209 [Antrodiella citrinella]